jgi:hypothetical protein
MANGSGSFGTSHEIQRKVIFWYREFFSPKTALHKMYILSQILIGSLLLNTACIGVGSLLGKLTVPAAVIIRGWTVFLLLCTLVWFGGFAAMYLAPFVWVFLAIGVARAVRKLPVSSLIKISLGTGLISLLFSLPFLKYPDLLAYAHSGTDQWGYAGVSKWLVNHSVNELPQLGEKMGLNWVWHVLSDKERPLVFTVLAVIAGSLGCSTIIAYYILPVALFSAVFICFALEERPLGIGQPAVAFILSLAVALQPLLLLHFQYQFLGGTIAALVLILVVVGLFHTQAHDAQDILFPTYAILLCTLIGGLYTLTVAIPGIAMIVITFGYARLRFARQSGRWLAVTEYSQAMWAACLLGLTILCFLEINHLSPGFLSLSSPIPPGKTGHIWAQFASVFGEDSITPWMCVDGTPGVDPAAYLPPGSTIGIILVLTTLAWLVFQSWRAWFRNRQITGPVVFGLCVAALYLASPPRGSHWAISRSLPIFGGVLLVMVPAIAVGEKNRWVRLATIAICLSPVIRGAPKLAPYFLHPEHRFTEQRWASQPLSNDVWDCLACTYFYDDSRIIDWSAAPGTFDAFTHYLPDEVRPRLVGGQVIPASSTKP